MNVAIPLSPKENDVLHLVAFHSQLDQQKDILYVQI